MECETDLWFYLTADGAKVQKEITTYRQDGEDADVFRQRHRDRVAEAMVEFPPISD